MISGHVPQRGRHRQRRVLRDVLRSQIHRPAYLELRLHRSGGFLIGLCPSVS